MINLMKNYMAYLIVWIIDLYMLISALVQEIVLLDSKCYYFFPTIWCIYIGLLIFHIVCGVLILMQNKILGAKKILRILFIVLYTLTFIETYMVFSDMSHVIWGPGEFPPGSSLYYVLPGSCVFKIYYIIVSNILLIEKPKWGKRVLSLIAVIILIFGLSESYISSYLVNPWH